MKLEKNWENKSLENLEKSVWNKPEFSSNLITTCYELRKKQLKDFTIEDLRLLIGQNIGLNYLMPIAIEKLKITILAAGNLYEGDLLKSVLTSDVDYWKREKNNWASVCRLFEEQRIKLDYTHKEILIAFKAFQKINE